MVQNQKNVYYVMLSSIANDLRERGHNAHLEPVTKYDAYNPNFRPVCNIKIVSWYNDNYSIFNLVLRIFDNGQIDIRSTTCGIASLHLHGIIKTIDIFDPQSIDKLYLYIELFKKLIKHKQFTTDPNITPGERIRRETQDLEIMAEIFREYYSKELNLKSTDLVK